MKHWDIWANIFGPTGTKLLPISITASISRKYSTSVREQCDIKTEPKIQVRSGVRPNDPNDPIKGTNPSHQY